MGIVERIRRKAKKGQFEFSKHAVDQTIVRHITVSEVREAVETCEWIEDYPDDERGPSCLLLGITRRGRPLHLQCSYPSRPVVKIITVYEPDDDLWIEHRVRRSRNERNNG